MSSPLRPVISRTMLLFFIVGDILGGAIWSAFPVLGAASCAALIVQKLVEDAVIFAYAGGPLACGLVLGAITGPTEEIDPASLADA